MCKTTATIVKQKEIKQKIYHRDTEAQRVKKGCDRGKNNDGNDSNDVNDKDKDCPPSKTGSIFGELKIFIIPIILSMISFLF